MNRSSMIASLVLGLGACVASAGSINLAFDSFAGRSNIQEGHRLHEITSGSQAGAVFGSFCIDLAERVGTGT